MDTTKHGQDRDFRQVTRYGEPVEYVDATTGETVYAGPSCSLTEPVGERWCETCQEWLPQRGILARVFGCPKCGRAW